jgi:hypothetical protein
MGLEPIATRLDAVNEQLSKDFPNYAALARPLPLSVDEVQAQLRADEALVLFLVTSDSNLYWLQLREETFVWVVTKSEVRLVRTDLGSHTRWSRNSCLPFTSSRWSWNAIGTQIRLLYDAEATPRFGKQTASINRRTSVKAMCIRTIGNAARLVAAIAFNHVAASTVDEGLPPSERSRCHSHSLFQPKAQLRLLARRAAPPRAMDGRTRSLRERAFQAGFSPFSMRR